MSNRRVIGCIASVLAAVGWGFAGIFATLGSVPALTLTSYRTGIGALILTGILYASGRKLSWDIIRGSWLGGITLAIDMATFFSAIKFTSIVDATVITALQPALVLVLARPLFGERIGRWNIVWIFIAMAGVAITVLGSGVPSGHKVLGDVLAIGSLLAWSAYWLVSKNASTTYDALEYTTGVTIVAAIAVVPITLLSGQSLGHIPPHDWLWIGLVILIPGSSHLVMNWAHQYVDASISSAIGSSNPIYAAIAADFILGQRLTVTQVVGGLLGIGAIVVVIFRHSAVEPN